MQRQKDPAIERVGQRRGLRSYMKTQTFVGSHCSWTITEEWKEAAGWNNQNVLQSTGKNWL